MEDVGPKLLTILLGSGLSVFNAALFLLELYLSLRVTRAIKFGEMLTGKMATLGQFLLAMMLANLAFSGLNGQISRYLNGLLSGTNPPLTKIILLIEAVVFFYIFFSWYRRREE